MTMQMQSPSVSVRGQTKAKVTTRAVIQRVNRKLAPESQALRKSRSAGELQNLGDYYILDTYRNTIIDHHVNFERYARECNALAQWETLDDGE